MLFTVLQLQKSLSRKCQLREDASNLKTVQSCALLGVIVPICFCFQILLVCSTIRVKNTYDLCVFESYLTTNIFKHALRSWLNISLEGLRDPS